MMSDEKRRKRHWLGKMLIWALGIISAIVLGLIALADWMETWLW